MTSPLQSSNLNIFSLGLFDFNKKSDEAMDFRFEQRFDKKIFDLGPAEEPLYIISPFYSIEITSDSAIYALGGIFVEEKISKSFYITPSFGAGFFSKGDGKDLGGSIEFRSTLELSYEMKSKNRIGISWGHISNANLGNKNPGVEILSLSYQTSF